MNQDSSSYPENGLSKERYKALREFCENLNLRFNDYSLLDLAFHHKSFSNESASYKRCNNERLEFLGDSVLGLATAAFLYKDMTGSHEGDLAKIKATVVSESSLAAIALEKMHVDRYLVLGRGEECSGGRTKKAILADAVEAVIGALYIDCGYESAEAFVLDIIVPEIRAAQSARGAKDYKTILQEYYQKKTSECPVYRFDKVEGPDHDRTFFVSVKLGAERYGPAAGKTKRAAEQGAAAAACRALGLS